MELSDHLDLKIVVNSSLQTISYMVFRIHITKGSSSRPMRWINHIDSQVDKLLPEVWITRDSGRTSFGGVGHHGHAGRHRVDHCQRLHTPRNLLRRNLSSFPVPSDDDDEYSNTGRLQCTPLGVVLKLDRYERHSIRK